MSSGRPWALAAAAALLTACPNEPSLPLPGELIVSEIVASNAGGGPSTARDEAGDYDDWIELHNLSDHTLDLAGLWVSDFLGNPSRHRIPEEEPIVIEPGGYLLLFADGETHQGPLHLPFRLSSEGEALSVFTSTGARLDEVSFPALQSGQSYARGETGFAVCDTPTPGGPNLCTKEMPPPKERYLPYDWPAVWPPPPAGPVVLSEIDPEGDRVELFNASAGAVDLASATLAFGASGLPELSAAARTATLSGSLAAGARIVVEAPRLGDSARLILSGPDGTVWDEEVYEAVEAGTVLALPEDGSGLRRACANRTLGEPNRTCETPSRSARPAFLRAVRSAADMDALSTHGQERTAGARSVKFVIDRHHDNRIYLFDSERWRLHFDWIWEQIDGNRPFDLCDSVDRNAHAREWARFSGINYFSVEPRRYYLGTLLFYPENGLLTVEFAAGDRISPAMVQETFFTLAARVFNGDEYAFRPTTTRLEQVAAELDGTLPIVPAAAAFEGQSFQALNPGVAYGVLERVKASELAEAPVSFQTIAILDELPNDVPPLGGTITEAFQTPLAHVNVLAQNRGTPNMALLGASTDPRIEPFLGRLARLEVTGEGFSLEAATATEAAAFWELRRQETGVFVPAKDLSRRALVDLAEAGFQDVVRIGAKASQLAELSNLNWFMWSGGVSGACAFTQLSDRLPVPRPAFAIPFARYFDHLEKSGASALVEALLEDEEALQNPVLRRERLAEIRSAIRTAAVDPELLSSLETAVSERFGRERVRFRSSTNVEDLAGFNGAGLYESASAQAGSDVRPIADALRRVWASAWSFRAFEERALFGVDQREVMMGVLVHRGFPGEEANGVAITRNVVNPESHGFYINAQLGEISVVNPNAGVLPEQLLYKLFHPPEVVVLARSSVTGGAPVLQDPELHRLSCALTAAHNRFREHYRQEIPSDRFAVDVEFKIDGSNREVFLKQARPWIEHREVSTSCE